jgi:hypothetical protein
LKGCQTQAYVLAAQIQRQRFAQHWARHWVPRWLGHALSGVRRVTVAWREQPAVKEAFKAESLMEFYDIWVARDTDGNLFLKREPYVTDPYSLERIARGLPFPVKCCWNGMVALNSAPFLRHGVRIRWATSRARVCARMVRMQFRQLSAAIRRTGGTRRASARRRSAACCATTSCAWATPASWWTPTCAWPTSSATRATRTSRPS